MDFNELVLNLSSMTYNATNASLYALYDECPMDRSDTGSTRTMQCVLVLAF